MSIHLSPRLQKIANYVLPGGCVVDVGTDHAYVPIWLLQEGICDKAWATDVKSGPLERARADALQCGVAEKLTLLLCDGLALCPPEVVDTVIVAGMGGETIQGILERSPWALEKRLILQAQTKQTELRAWLADQGLTVEDAALCDDAGRIYLIWLLGRGTEPDLGAVDRALLRKRDPLLRPWLEDRIKREMKQLRGLELARSRDETALLAQRRELEELKRLHQEVLTW